MATGDDDEIEEERRLLYVALTRARDALHVYVPAALLPQAARARGPALVRAALALPRAGTRCARRSRTTGREVDAAPGGVDVAGTVDVDAYLAGLWSG